MRKLFLLSLLFSFLCQMNAQQTKILTAEKHNEYGLVYTLPITAFKIDVVAVKETKKAGPFFKYAKKFAGDSKVIMEDSENWIIESVHVFPYGIPDDENRYLMQLKSGATTFIGVANDGMLLSINTEPQTVVSPALEFSEIEGEKTSGKEYLEYVNEDFISAQSSFKKAQLLGEELMEVRDAKVSLTRGTAETMPTDGRQLELMLASLEKQEKAIMQAFSGNSWKERIVRSFSFVPDEEKKSILFRMSDFAGIVNSEDYSGDPVYIKVKIIDEPALPTDSKGEEKKLPKDAVIYSVPGTAELTISDGTKTWFSEAFEMSQFGTTFGLNPAIFTDKKEPSYAIFDPATGALKELGTIK